MTREEAIYILDNLKPTNAKSSFDAYVVGKAITMAIEALSAEPLTDKEKRIFLSAMCREEKVCMKIDEGHSREIYEDTLLYVCRSITRKVKGALWK